MDEFGRYARLNRLLIVFKIVIFRGYLWCQLPALALIGAGVLTPYVQQYNIKISMWQLGLISMVIILAVGLLDRWLGLFQAESSYGTEKNPMLLNLLNKEKEEKK